MGTNRFTTVFGSLDDYVRGEIQVVDDDPKNYAFSNVFEIASRSAPWEKVVAGRNREYVIEVLRAQGRSEWFIAPHDEFALLMDGVLEIDLVKPDAAARILPPGTAGAVTIPERPEGTAMGSMKLRRGHQALLPAEAAYRFTAVDGIGVIVLQTMLGRHSIERWPEICCT